MSLLLHICCAHCLGKALSAWREAGEGLPARGFFYNPNIHPLLEFRRRIKALRIYLERDRLETEIVEEYGLARFCTLAHPEYAPPERCARCYRERLARTAARAAELGCAEFATTMAASPHQDHDLIRALGAEEGARHEVKFVYRDLRGSQMPERLSKGLYRQQYCGCVFSEEERYRDTTRHLYGADSADET